MAKKKCPKLVVKILATLDVPADDPWLQKTAKLGKNKKNYVLTISHPEIGDEPLKIVSVDAVLED